MTDDDLFELEVLRQRWADDAPRSVTAGAQTPTEAEPVADPCSVTTANSLLSSIQAAVSSRQIASATAVGLAIAEVRKSLGTGDFGTASAAALTLERLLIAVVAPGRR